jgi:hypothetical protein
MDGVAWLAGEEGPIAAGAPMDDNLDFKMYKVNLR